MFDFNSTEHAAYIVGQTASLAEACVAQVIEEVKARTAYYEAAAIAVSAGANGGGRTYNYDMTPGTGSQAFAAFHKAAHDMLIDDMKRSRADPESLVARWRLMMSSAIYAAAGARFADIVVHRSAVDERDPLDRPALNEKRYKQSRSLQAKDLDQTIANAVCDAASGDSVRVTKAMQTLRNRIHEGDMAEVQVAAVLLGQIGDPIEQRKINRLAEQIERERWQANAEASIISGSAAPEVTPAAVPISDVPQSQVVTSGGETARRVTPGPASAAVDDLATFYGEDD